MTEDLPEGVSKETAEFLLNRQPRCIVCGSTYALHIHHRVFRSEGERGVKRLLDERLSEHKECRNQEITPWSLHSIQNLVVLCTNCHEGSRVGVHGGNEALRQFLRNSFTSPKTGFNIPFYGKHKTT